MISRVTTAFAVFAGVVSLGCIRLGIWQLERHNERQATNARIIARLVEAPVSILSLHPDSLVRFKRVRVTGRYDFANEMVLTSRGRHGAPGVHVVTPLRLESSDSAVLVNRGWAYSPDGMKIDLSLFREDSNNVVVDGYLEEFSTTPGAVSTSSVSNGIRRLDYDSISVRVPYPLSKVIVVQRSDSGDVVAVDKGHPVRADPPPLNAGPHRAYAIQWFAFALVGVIGTILVLQRDRRRGTIRPA
jgi:surfeit locus 1 family protein